MSACDCPECQERRRVDERENDRFWEGLLTAAVFAALVLLAVLWLASGGN